MHVAWFTFTGAALVMAQTDCSHSPTNFWIYEDRNGNETANSVSMFYNISSTNNLIIGAAASDNVNNRPTHPVGHIAYNNRYDPNNAVQFGTAAFVRENRGSFSRVKCHIEDSSDGDGTCDLVCTGKGKGHVVTVGFSVETKNDDQWHLGTGGNRAIHVKAVF